MILGVDLYASQTTELTAMEVMMAACDKRVRGIVRDQHSLPVREVVRRSGHPEADVRKVLREMGRGEPRQ